MDYTCIYCAAPLNNTVRSEVTPDTWHDDATVRLLACPNDPTHGGLLILVQTERRGAMDDESVDVRTFPLTHAALAAQIAAAETCPRLEDDTCPCAWHISHTGALVMQQTFS